MNTDHQKSGLPALSLRQLHYALAAADLGNVTAAARQLNVSQPAVSAAIAALESHYRSPLFVRQPGHGIAVTGFGRSLFDEIRGLLKQARAVFDMSESSGPLRGEITIGIYQALSPYYLPTVLTDLKRHLPDVQVAFFEATLDALMVRLHAGRADFCISYDVAVDAEANAVTLYALRPFILAAAGHRLARQASATLKELRNETLILLDQEASAHYVLGLLNAHAVRPASIIRAQSFELQRSFVANGMGLALSHTRPMVDAAYDGKPLATIPVAGRIEPQRVLLLTSRRHRQSPAAVAAAKIVQTTFKTIPQAAVGDRILIGQKKRA